MDYLNIFQIKFFFMLFKNLISLYYSYTCGCINKDYYFQESKVKKFIIPALFLSGLTAGLTGCGLPYQQPDPVEPVNYKADKKHHTAAQKKKVNEVATPSASVAADGYSGRKATQRDIIVYRSKGVVYHDGHPYHIRDGKYVLAR